MSNQQRLLQLVDFLNINPATSFADVRKILWDGRICRYLFRMAGQKTAFSLLTRQEAHELPEVSDAYRPSLEVLRSALITAAPDKHGTLLTNFHESEERIIFPDDIETESGGCGRQLFIAALAQAVKWFRNFMAGCAAGRMDVKTLNEFKYTKGFVMEFQPSQNPMNPALSVAELYDTGDDLVERKLLCNFIYPFIFSGQGGELTKVRQCRNCNTYFIGKRISATFCNSKCRNAFYYEQAK